MVLPDGPMADGLGPVHGGAVRMADMAELTTRRHPEEAENLCKVEPVHGRSPHGGSGSSDGTSRSSSAIG